MTLIVKQRPEVILSDGIPSRLNSVFTAMPYTFKSDKYPVNTFDATLTGSLIAYDAVRRGTKITSLSTTPSYVFNVLEKVMVNNSGITELDGLLHTIKYVETEVGGEQTIYLHVNIGTQTSDSCLYIKQYENYKAQVKINGGFPDYHVYSKDGSKPVVLIDELDVVFRYEGGENLGRLDVSKILLQQLNSDFNYKNEDGLTGQRNGNSPDLLTFSTLEFAESYDVTDGLSTENVVFDYVKDYVGTPSTFKGLLNSEFNDTPFGFNWYDEIRNAFDQPAENLANTIEYQDGRTVFTYDNTFSGISQSRLLTQNVDMPSEGSLSGVVEIETLSGDFVTYDLELKIELKDEFDVWSDFLVEVGVPSGVSTYEFIIDSLVDYKAIRVGVRYTAAGTAVGFEVAVNSFRMSAFEGLINPDYDNGLDDWILALLTNSEPTIAMTPVGGLINVLNESDSLSSKSRMCLQNVVINPNTVHTVIIDYDVISIGVQNPSQSLRLVFKTGNGVNEPSTVATKILSATGSGRFTFELTTPNEILQLGWNLEVYNPNLDNALYYSQGAFAVNQFQNKYGGNLGVNVMRSLVGVDVEELPKLLTDFETPRVFTGKETYLNSMIAESTFVLRTGGIDIRCDVIGNDGLVLSSDVILESIVSRNDGIYLSRLNIQDVLTGEGIGVDDWKSISVFYVSYDDLTSEKISESKTFINSKICRTDGLELRWLNTSGGWESYYFENYSSFEEEIRGQNFINGDTVEEMTMVNAQPVVTLFSDWLSVNEYAVLQRAKRSIKMQMKMKDKIVGGVDFGQWQTTRIDSSTVSTYNRENKTREVSFKVKLPKLLIQNL